MTTWISPAHALPDVDGAQCVLLSPAADVVLGPFRWRTTPPAWVADDGGQMLVIPPEEVGWWMLFEPPTRVVLT